MRGATPMPTTTKSQSTVSPPARRTRSARPEPSIASTAVPVRRSTPWSRWIAPYTSPTSRPSTRSSGTSSCSISVTSSPFWRAEAATSAPIQPAPITATLLLASIAARSASLSAKVRR